MRFEFAYMFALHVAVRTRQRGEYLDDIPGWRVLTPTSFANVQYTYVLA
jgi:hypothetical protein